MSSLVKSLFSNWPTEITKRVRAAAAHLAAVEIWVVAIFVAASVAFVPMLPWALGVAGLFWVIRYLAYGYLSIRTPADWPIALLVLMIPATLWATALPDVTRPPVYRLLTGIALYYAIVNWVASSARLRSLKTGTVLSGLLLALGALVSVDWPSRDKLALGLGSFYARLPLLVSDAVNRNVMAGALVILLPCALALLLFGWRQLCWRDLILIGLAALVMTGVLILTQSRGGLMALGATLIMMTLLRWRRGWLLIPVVAMAATVAVRSLGIVPVLNALTTNDTLGGLDFRLEVWSRALYMIQDFPFTGIGMGSFQEVAEVLYPFFLPSRDVPHAHSLFLQVAVDLGIAGLIAWLAIVMLVVTAAWQVYRHGRSTGDSGLAGLGAGLLCSQLALVVHGMVDAATWGAVRPGVITWAIWALAMASWNVAKKASEDHRAENGIEDIMYSDLASLPEKGG